MKGVLNADEDFIVHMGSLFGREIMIGILFDAQR